MTDLKDIVFETDHYWVKRVPKGFEVYKTGLTHSARVAVIGYTGDKGLQRAKLEIERREAARGPSGRHHATKKTNKSSAQLEREINEALHRRVDRGEVAPYEGMPVLVTKYGAMHHGLRAGVRGVIKRVASPDVRFGSPTSRASVLVNVHGAEFSTQWPTAALRVMK